MEGHQKRFYLEASVAVYLTMERTKLEPSDLCERQSWHFPQVKALATWTDCTKKQVTMDTYMQWAADSLGGKGIVTVIVMQVIDFVFADEETASELTNFLPN